MSAPNLTEAEIAHLLKQPDVAVTLARFNKAQMYQTADHQSRIDLMKRYRMFDAISRNK